MEMLIIFVMIIVTAAGAIIYFAHEWAGSFGLVALAMLIIALYALYLRRCYRNARSR